MIYKKLKIHRNQQTDSTESHDHQHMSATKQPLVINYHWIEALNPLPKDTKRKPETEEQPVP